MTTALAAASSTDTAPPSGTDLVAVNTSPLALRSGQVDWTPEQRAGLAALGCGDVDAPTAHLFLNQCLRTGLDPFLRQIYLVGRPNKRTGTTTYTIQLGIDGLRLLADRAAARAHQPRGMKPTLWYDDQGKAYEAWVRADAPAAARVTVTRGGQEFTAVARTGAYMARTYDGNAQGLWRTMPDVMIAKCAEALALRMAFPADLSGLYTDDEMAQADAAQMPGTPAVAAPQTPPAGQSGNAETPQPATVTEHTNPDPQAAYDLAVRAMGQTDADAIDRAKTWANGQGLLEVAVTSAVPRAALELLGLNPDYDTTLEEWLDGIAAWLVDNGTALSAGEPVQDSKG